jgi:hypothetical protein
MSPELRRLALVLAGLALLGLMGVIADRFIIDPVRAAIGV